MPTYRIESEGKTYRVQSEKPLSDDQIMSFVSEARGAAAPKQVEMPIYDAMGMPTGGTEMVTPGRKDPLGVGVSTALLEPVYGAGELVPGEVGKASARKAAELEQKYKQTAADFPVVTRAGYLTGLLGTTAIPVGGAAKTGASLAGTMLRGAGAGAVAGGLTPTGKEDYEERLKEKGKSAVLGAALGGTIPGVISGATGLARGIAKPAPIGERAGFVNMGERLEQKVKSAAGAKLEARSQQADQLYEDALNVARKSQAESGAFADSPAGREVANKLRNMKQVVINNQPFEVGKNKIDAIDRLLNAIESTKAGGEVSALGKGKISSKVGVKAPVKTTPKDVDAVVEQLRFLREVNKPGADYTGFAALDANTRRDLINTLQKGLYDWNEKYRVADEAYKAASEQLRPFQTRLMSRLLKKEKFDPSELAADTESFAKEFFNTRDSVRQLKTAIEDNQFVQDLSKDYISTIFSNKTPKEVLGYAKDPANEGWMREAGIYDAVQKYADQATTAESRQEILKKLGSWTVRGVGAGLGLGAVHKLFGL